MNRTELTKLNVGYNLDWLMNLDPRGYGVCRILYDGASKYTGKPLSLNGAEGLVKNIKKGEKVFILTGFILLPWNEAETDGIISSTVFARFVIRAFGAKPVMIVPEQCEKAIKAMSEVLGVNITYDIDNIPDNTICIISFTKDKNKENEYFIAGLSGFAAALQKGKDGTELATKSLDFLRKNIDEGKAQILLNTVSKETANTSVLSQKKHIEEG